MLKTPQVTEVPEKTDIVGTVGETDTITVIGIAKNCKGFPTIFDNDGGSGKYLKLVSRTPDIIPSNNAEISITCECIKPVNTLPFKISVYDYN